ncbi:TetR family transcriptional regulator [Prauserella marina]|uniref:DNA-binding transcriptional regulator, AcrR family n=1 Tax=Prauserella marina TaxID=530584 RepID=A0A222VNT8_9PSEU|nr:TetR family transcriptional regulator [Prauserella marina]ASR35580.1 TetR family transcriptional regulator [Prauserella marina]PWV84566.1 TetR family transcriptional regulator [Prauserella marina]SDC19020.1 DNA-binding transcriptional regulator, AcrR family [Prauserella marina]
MSHSEAETPSVRKRRATKARIAATAARLAGEHGLSRTTVNRIASEAEVARATFFRYYETKESAVADGVTAPWLTLVTEAIARQPARLSPKDALVAAFAELADQFPAHGDRISELARLNRRSPALDAWTAQTYLRYEKAITEQLTPRFAKLTEHDPRPRLLAALTMAAIRISLDEWIAHGGRLPELVHGALTAITVDPN